jgi:hypothetical protein
MFDGQCCHEFCLGGCTGPGPEDCVACRDVIFGKRCVKQCPAETYKVRQIASCETLEFRKLRNRGYN